MGPHVTDTAPDQHPMTGSIKMVPMTQVEILDVSLGEFTAVISHWGIGSKELIACLPTLKCYNSYGIEQTGSVRP